MDRSASKAGGDPRRRHALPFLWPTPPLQIVLVEPEIPPNTGNIARLCAATGAELHLVEPLGFRLTDAAVRRSGLDYWESVRLFRHADFAAYLAAVQPRRLFFFSTAGTKSLFEARFAAGDALIFGSETAGLPESLLAQYPGQVFGIPIQAGKVRSLNLANCAAIVLYEALRQIQPSE